MKLCFSVSLPAFVQDILVDIPIDRFASIHITTLKTNFDNRVLHEVIKKVPGYLPSRLPDEVVN